MTTSTKSLPCGNCRKAAAIARGYCLSCYGKILRVSRNAKIPIPGVHPFINFIYNEYRGRGLTQSEICHTADVAAATMRTWFGGGKINLYALTDILGALGYEVYLRKKEKP